MAPGEKLWRSLLSSGRLNILFFGLPVVPRSNNSVAVHFPRSRPSISWAIASQVIKDFSYFFELHPVVVKNSKKMKKRKTTGSIKRFEPAYGTQPTLLFNLKK
jgi:hypothetical protein